MAPALAIGRYDFVVGIGRLRILVEILQVGMGRCAIEVEIVFLHVFSVIALAVGQPEQSLLDDRIAAIPKREGKAEPLPIVANPGQAILAPVIRPRAGLIVTEVVPRIPVLAVVLAHGPPLALAQVRPPLFPRNAFVPGFVETMLLSAHLLEAMESIFP